MNRHGATIGKYERLHCYLRDRFANRVVLTFAEIEDLVGFQLPVGARVDAAWWYADVATGVSSPQSDAWTLASRTAVVNLQAQRVLFDRISL